MQQLFFERAIRCASNQTMLVTKYFKILACAYSMADNFKENFRDIPASFRQFLENLEKQSGQILEVLAPARDGESVKAKLEKLVETIGRCMHKQKESKEAMYEPVEESAQEGRELRDSILDLIEVCKKMTFALTQQIIESKATLEVLESSFAKLKEDK